MKYICLFTFQIICFTEILQKNKKNRKKQQELTISFQNAVFKIENTNFHLLLLRLGVIQQLRGQNFTIF